MSTSLQLLPILPVMNAPRIVVLLVFYRPAASVLFVQDINDKASERIDLFVALSESSDCVMCD
jgi:hypothetical protein